tara:strand:+ start:544 stop:657 length:114 start_codon:yes stop_codon:yes gene_type:complete
MSNERGLRNRAGQGRAFMTEQKKKLTVPDLRERKRTG